MLAIIWLNATVTVPTSSPLSGSSREMPKFPRPTSFAFPASFSRGRVKVPIIRYSSAIRQQVTPISTAIINTSRYRRYRYSTS